MSRSARNGSPRPTTLKAILPPRAVDTPEELAQLSQFVINIIDFRDPDATMTHWANTDVCSCSGTPRQPLPIPASEAPTDTVRRTRQITFDQYGMEYNPIAIDEVLAYSFQRQFGLTPTPHLDSSSSW